MRIPVIARYQPSLQLLNLMDDAMISGGFVKELWRLLGVGRSLAASARMTEMTDKTARKYRDDGRLPSERKLTENWRRRWGIVVNWRESFRTWTLRYRGFGKDMKPFDDGDPEASWRNCPAK